MCTEFNYLEDWEASDVLRYLNTTSWIHLLICCKMHWRKPEQDKMGTWSIACTCGQNCRSPCFKKLTGVFEELPVLKEYNRELFHGDRVQKWVEIMDKEATSINSHMITLSFSILLVSLVELSNGVYVSLCAQNTNVQLKPQNIVEETKAP